MSAPIMLSTAATGCDTTSHHLGRRACALPLAAEWLNAPADRAERLQFSRIYAFPASRYFCDRR